MSASRLVHRLCYLCLCLFARQLMFNLDYAIVIFTSCFSCSRIDNHVYTIERKSLSILCILPIGDEKIYHCKFEWCDLSNSLYFSLQYFGFDALRVHKVYHLVAFNTFISSTTYLFFRKEITFALY